jgi:hypothetical protein
MLRERGVSDQPSERGPARREKEEKQAYESPRLIEYGRAVDLTGGGVGSKAETGQPKLDKFP